MCVKANMFIFVFQVIWSIVLLQLNNITVSNPPGQKKKKKKRNSRVAQVTFYNVVKLSGIFNLGYMRCVLYHFQFRFRSKKPALFRKKVR